MPAVSVRHGAAAGCGLVDARAGHRVAQSKLRVVAVLFQPSARARGRRRAAAARAGRESSLNVAEVAADAALPARSVGRAPDAVPALAGSCVSGLDARRDDQRSSPRAAVVRMTPLACSRVDRARR